MTNNKILIVDDNPEIREVLNVLLSSEGYDVIEAKDGQEARQLGSLFSHRQSASGRSQ